MRVGSLVATMLAVLSLSCEQVLFDPENRETSMPPPATAFAMLLDSLRTAADFPALAGAIVTPDSVLEIAAVGSRRFGGPANVTLADQFHLGSNTKALTAVLIGTLVDEGAVSWSATLPELFPELASSMQPAYRPVTLRELMAHGSGLPRDPGLTIPPGSPTAQRAAVVAWAMQQPPAAARGTYLYSNLGYIIAGAIAERLTGRAYEDLVTTRVLTPLGITTGGFGPMGTPGAEDEPLQHTFTNAPVEPSLSADNPPIYNPAGRLHMAIGDWARFIRWVLACEAGRATIVTPATAGVLTSGLTPMPGEGAYAMGWLVVSRSWAGGRALTHSGSNSLNYSVAWLAPGRKFGVILMTNRGGGTTDVKIDEAAARLIGHHLGTVATEW